MRPKLRFIIVAVLMSFLLAAVYYSYMKEQGNFHAITAGEAYRSAQLDRDELEYYIKKYNIKSVFNLRGSHPDEPWYKEELMVCEALNVAHHDISLSASREPSGEDTATLIEFFRGAARPVLIHCLAGTDRSGLVAAMWKVVVDNEPKKEAEKELSILYGHIAIGKTAAMDRFFHAWNPGHMSTGIKFTITANISILTRT